MKREEITITIEPAGYFGTLEEQSGHTEPTNPSKIIIVHTPGDNRAQTVEAFENDDNALGAIADIVPPELHYFVEDSIKEELKGERFALAAKAITGAQNLDELHTALIEAEELATEHETKLTEFVNTSELPTFGTFTGDTLEVFSWDETRLLIQGNPWQLVPREEATQ